MKNCVLGVCVVLFLVFSNLSSMGVNAASPSNLTEEEAISIGKDITNDFTEIVKEGAVEEFFGSFVYERLLEWRDILDELGFYYGIMDVKATVDSEKADIVVKVDGSKRIGVIEYSLFFDQEQLPEIKAYSKFSLAKWLNYTGIGAFLTIFNTIAVVILFILYLNNQKSLPVAERNQAIDDTIARIIHNEENGHDEAGEGLDGLAEPEDEELSGLMEPGEEALGESEEGDVETEDKESPEDEDDADSVISIAKA